MWGGDVIGGDLGKLVVFLVTVGIVVLAAPVVLFFIRLLNQTWLDEDWRAARRLRRAFKGLADELDAGVPDAQKLPPEPGKPSEDTGFTPPRWSVQKGDEINKG